jgi:hypothetical protein
MDTKNQPPVIRAKDRKPKKQWLCVMNRNYQVDEEFGIEIAYCIDVIGIASALEKARFYMKQAAKVNTNLEYRIEGREWS